MASGDGYLVFEGVSKRFGEFAAVEDVSFSIGEGEIFSLLGPSGCGKTTLLRIVAGFLQPDAGRILLDGMDITAMPPEKRPVNTVFQNYALFPHMNVRENIGFGLRMARRPRAEIDREVEKMLSLVDLEAEADKPSTAISGGQKQRVALARALVNKPRVLLLDEPLAALDLKLRQRLLVELDDLHDEVGTTFLYVTHDQGEAMAISDRIGVMNRGELVQTGTPGEIYETPVDSFVAAFIGDTNFFRGRVTQRLDGKYSRAAVDGLGEIMLSCDRDLAVGETVNVSLRPEKLRLVGARPDAARTNGVAGRIEDVIYLGSSTRYWVRAGDGDGHLISIERQHSRVQVDGDTPPTWDDDVWLAWHADDAFLLESFREEDVSLLPLEPMNGARESRKLELLTTLPSLGWLALFFLVPTLVVVAMSFKETTVYGGLGEGWSLDAWRAMANPSYPPILGRTLWLSGVATVICLALALPTAYLMGRAGPRRRSVLLLLVIVPFWTNFLIRVFAWKQILHPQGFLRDMLVGSGLIGDSTLLLYNPGAVVLVMVYTYLPFAILPLYAAAEKFDFGLLDAARDLGAGALRAFGLVFLPGVRRGVVAALAMVLIPALGSYVIPEIVGGPSGEMGGNKIAQRAFVDRNLPHASALAVVLVLVLAVPGSVLGGLVLIRRRRAADRAKRRGA